MGHWIEDASIGLLGGADVPLVEASHLLLFLV
jgi:hypothetical protein